ncbi:MAG: glycosyltransferase [Acidobacteriota bacterium]|nr:glycosyltransferase [Acidobacteriota bacterium]
MERGLVSVVLVTWNSARYLRRCLEGIWQQTHRSVELLAVDNASSDESVQLVAPHAATLIRNETNRGFSAAVNQAIAVARGEFVLLLNPDCHLLPEYIARLVEAMQTSDDIGSATGLLMRARGYDIEPTEEIDSAGMRMTRNGRHLDITRCHPERSRGIPREQATTASVAGDPSTPLGMTWGARAGVILSEAKDLPARHGEGPSPSSRLRMTPGQPFEVFGVSGAAGMFRMSFLRDAAIDGEIFDEDFFAYREDADLAWRGRLFGWQAICEPRAIAYHVRRVTPDARRELPAEINMHSVKNRFLLRLKNQGAYLALRNLPFELVRDLIVIFAALAVERSSLPAFTWLWRNRARIRAKRRAIQQRRKVSDRALARWFR